MSYITSEKKVQNKIISFCKKLENLGYPIYCERRQAGGFSYKAGQADLYIIYNGQHIEIEVKKENGKQKELQLKWEEKCKRLNCLYILADSFDSFYEQISSIIELEKLNLI